MNISIDSFNVENLALEESLFHVANGYLGLRACLDEGNGYCRGFYINGFYDESPISYGEKFKGYPDKKQAIVKLPDIQTIKLLIDGEELVVSQCNILEYEHKLDMEKGYALRRFVISTAKSGLIEIKTKRMASFIVPNLLIIEYSIKSMGFSGDVKIVSSVDGDVYNFSDPSDPRLASMAEKPLIIDECSSHDDVLKLKAHCKHSKLNFICNVFHNKPDGFSLCSYNDEKQAYSVFEGCLEPEKKIKFQKICLFADSFHYEKPEEVIINSLSNFKDCTYYFEEQIEYLKGFWNSSRIVINGDENLQRAMDFSLYSLLCSVGRDNVFSVAAKGLSGEGYEGHVFWDSEAYVAPFFILSKPDLAKKLLEYRYHILSFAKEQALLLGHKKGALFPWRSIEGGECSSYYPAGSAQYHINSDIAYAYMQYFYASHDLEFLESMAFELLLETSRLWLDMGHYTDKGFCIDMVTGPDEYTCLVNNNFYTNLGAKFNLLACVESLNILKENGRADRALSLTCPKEMQEIYSAAKNMYIPYDEKLDINPQDDSFLSKKVLDLDTIPKENFPLLLHYHPMYLYRHQVCKQADVVLAHVLHKDSASFKTKLNSFNYYSKITSHDSSLSLCAYAIMAAQLGLTDIAEEYFRATADLDLNNTHHNTKDGIHTANMGGSYLVISKGFAGIYMDSKGLSINPNKLHSISYSFNFKYRNSLLNIFADSKGFKLKLVDGDSVLVNIQGKDIVLEKNSSYLSSYKAIE